MFATSLDGALSWIDGSAYDELALQFGVSVDDISASFGYITLGLGCFMYVSTVQRISFTLNSHRLVQNVLAVKFGVRIIYLCSVFLVNQLFRMRMWKLIRAVCCSDVHNVYLVCRQSQPDVPASGKNFPRYRYRCAAKLDCNYN